ncbi:MAG: hypothetical protein U0792_24450 [Gemmataceae bacterium]
MAAIDPQVHHDLFEELDSMHATEPGGASFGRLLRRTLLVLVLRFEVDPQAHRRDGGRRQSLPGEDGGDRRGVAAIFGTTWGGGRGLVRLVRQVSAIDDFHWRVGPDVRTRGRRCTGWPLGVAVEHWPDGSQNKPAVRVRGALVVRDVNLAFTLEGIANGLFGVADEFEPHELGGVHLGRGLNHAVEFEHGPVAVNRADLGHFTGRAEVLGPRLAEHRHAKRRQHDAVGVRIAWEAARSKDVGRVALRETELVRVVRRFRFRAVLAERDLDQFDGRRREPDRRPTFTPRRDQQPLGKDRQTVEPAEDLIVKEVHGRERSKSADQHQDSPRSHTPPFGRN